jgi:hypothetical protein
MRLVELMTGAYVPHMLYVAAEFRLADLLADGPRSSDELAELAGAHAPSLARVLQALTYPGILRTEPDGRWALTELGEGLRSDIPGSQRPWVLLYGGIYQRAWGELLYSVRTGEPAFAHVFGAPLYDYLREHPGTAALMNATQTQSVPAWLGAVAEAYDFSQARTVVDVGGASGGLLAALLAAHPHLCGVLFDLPHAVAEAGPVLAQTGVAERCTVVAGDAFAEVPPGGDLYLLSRVLLNWGDERCVALLRRIRTAMSDGATLLVIDAVTPPGPLPRGVAEWDVFLLVIFGARVRHEPDFRALLEAAGFRLAEVHALPSQFSVLVCQPAS